MKKNMSSDRSSLSNKFLEKTIFHTISVVFIVSLFFACLKKQTTATSENLAAYSTNNNNKVTYIVGIERKIVDDIDSVKTKSGEDIKLTDAQKTALLTPKICWYAMKDVKKSEFTQFESDLDATDMLGALRKNSRIVSLVNSKEMSLDEATLKVSDRLNEVLKSTIGIANNSVEDDSILPQLINELSSAKSSSAVDCIRPDQLAAEVAASSGVDSTPSQSSSMSFWWGDESCNTKRVLLYTTWPPARKVERFRQCWKKKDRHYYIPGTQFETPKYWSCYCSTARKTTYLK